MSVSNMLLDDDDDVVSMMNELKTTTMPQSMGEENKNTNPQQQQNHHHAPVRRDREEQEGGEQKSSLITPVANNGGAPHPIIGAKTIPKPPQAIVPSKIQQSASASLPTSTPSPSTTAPRKYVPQVKMTMAGTAAKLPGLSPL